MNPPVPPSVPQSIFPTAEEDAKLGNTPTAVPQTEHPAYRLAFQDANFLLREDLRPVRFQLELMKPEVLLAEADIHSTFVFYGSARIPSPEEAPALIAAAETPERKAVAARLARNARYYDVARELAVMVSTFCKEGERCFTVCSGGGPSIMEAANRGAWESGAPSLGMNIVLPHEQVPNPYVTPGLSFQFHYFALRKMHFLMRAKAVAVFPGGFGTFDEFFELLTLVQTGKVAPLPILLYGREFWNRVVNFEALAEEGVIAPDDLKLFHFVETAEEGWAIVKAHYGL
ncbi:TIGR00730 family Rossman fold protein [Sandarakinorhabdus limnophila]|uniref:LOG family protein n=1 Tax=Sandarakinorhabdus limnophila TaxID=210512 RepID=UPI0026F3565D|nr:TIGR00730 family Rossman fold protein [Sandarakinorhabdus limnophila]